MPNDIFHIEREDKKKMQKRRRERIFPDVSQLFSPREYEPRRFSIERSKKYGYSTILLSKASYINTFSFLSIPHLRILESAIYSSFTQLYGNLQDVPE